MVRTNTQYLAAVGFAHLKLRVAFLPFFITNPSPFTLHARAYTHTHTHTYTHTHTHCPGHRLGQTIPISHLHSFKNVGAIDRVACKNLCFKISLTALWITRKLSLCCHLLEWFFPISSKEQGHKCRSWLSQGGYVIESYLRTHHRCWHLGQGE